VPRSYHTLNNHGKMNERKLTEFLSKNAQQFLPMVELIEQSRLAVEDLIDTVGRVTIQTVLHMSAEHVAGPPQQGKTPENPIFWHGRQGGSVYLKVEAGGGETAAATANSWQRERSS